MWHKLPDLERMHREDCRRMAKIRMAKIVMAKIIMAKIIEFYIPSSFRKNDKWIPPQERGKIIEFSLPAKKSA
jgi:hypothetical protein